jgi:hypothetical protein
MAISYLGAYRAKRQAQKTLDSVNEALFDPNPVRAVAEVLEMDLDALGIETFDEFVQVVQVRCFDLNRLIDPDFVPEGVPVNVEFYDDPA